MMIGMRYNVEINENEKYFECNLNEFKNDRKIFEISFYYFIIMEIMLILLYFRISCF